MNALSIYGGAPTAGEQDGDLITNNRKIALVGARGLNTSVKVYAMRTPGFTRPACIVRATFGGLNKEWFEVSLDRRNWGSGFICPYVAGSNVLFFIRANIPEDADYGDNINNYLAFEYKGGV